VRRVAHALTADKFKATGSDNILPQTIQESQKPIHRRKRRRQPCLPCYGFFSRGSSLGRAANDASNGGRRTQLDQRRSRFGTHRVRSAMFEALTVIASIYALYILKKWWFPGTQEQGFGATFTSRLSKPIAVVIRTRTTSQRSSQFYIPLPMDSEAEEEEEAENSAYGGLDIHIFEEDGQQRTIYHDFLQDQGGGDDDSVAAGDDEQDYYYAFDDDTKRNPYIGWEDKELQNEKQCRRVSWHRLLLINCNSFHELGLASNAVGSFSLKG
jgi:hypothetical protein